MKQTELVAFNEVTYFHHACKVVDRLSFNVKQGECMLLTGANGTGKTTILQLLAGLIRPDDGQILIHGFDLHEEPLLAKQHLGFLAHHPPLYPDLTVQEYLKWVAKLRRIPKAEQPHRIHQTLEDLNLKTVYRHLIRTLSKGLKQRLGIAQAMLHRPSILLLDEPTQGLDPYQIDVFQVLLTEYKKNKAIILSTHYLNEVKTICDKNLQLTHLGDDSYDIDYCPA